MATEIFHPPAVGGEGNGAHAHQPPDGTASRERLAHTDARQAQSAPPEGPSLHGGGQPDGRGQPPLHGRGRPSLRDPRRRGHRIRWLLTALFFAFLIRTFIGEASVVPTASMENTILVGDHLLLNKAFYGPAIPLTKWRLPRLRDVERGDIVAFRSPLDARQTFLKRVVAIGGDRVEIRDGLLYVNGKLMQEPYAWHRPGGAWRRQSIRPRTVPPDHMFVLGDNRDQSNDSRWWGSVPVENVIGEPILVYWSYDAPSAAWLERDPASRLRFYASIAANFFSGTRWGRTGTLL